ncbi:GNAT family N-acetyltransferase [Allostreptomyces psammosilenae]|uniref:N-acetyltransferase domain-containing protein n=1 Tax=Allostreptomyces psammosilenae TaxID=1892865 RepID=A0A853AAC9_9ACTN|nr:GNAT family N-acetyltransferase [Allostreptomyces psammosilenae]NYI07468.1 hypothetical protein [Allostreptomyces psammosilenae]
MAKEDGNGTGPTDLPLPGAAAEERGPNRAVLPGGVHGPRIGEPLRLESSGEAAAHAAAWRRLVTTLPDGGSYFMTPDWVLSWWRYLADSSGSGTVLMWHAPTAAGGGAAGRGHPGPGGRRAGGEIGGVGGEACAGGGRGGTPGWGTGPVGAGTACVAVLPLWWQTVPLHRRLPGLPRVPLLTLLGSGAGAADHLGFPARPCGQRQVRERLAELARRGTVLLPNLDESAIGAVPEGARLLERTACPRLELTPSREPGSPRLRKHVRAWRRRLHAAGVRFRWVAPKEMTAGLLEDVVRLHAARSHAIGRPTSFDRSRLPFHRSLLEWAEPEHGPAALLAEDSDGVPVGAVYGFQWQGCFSHYQTGWDPAYRRESLGTVLVAEAVRAVAEAGMRTYDFLRGAEDYKYRFEAEDRHDLSWVLPHGLSGAAWLLRERARLARDGRADGPTTG